VRALSASVSHRSIDEIQSHAAEPGKARFSCKRSVCAIYKLNVARVLAKHPAPSTEKTVRLWALRVRSTEAD